MNLKSQKKLIEDMRVATNCAKIEAALEGYSKEECREILLEATKHLNGKWPEQLRQIYGKRAK